MPTSVNSLQGKKEQIRKQITAIRNRLGNTVRLQYDQIILKTLQQLTEIITAKHIYCYISQGTEPDTHTLIDWMIAEGKRTSVPKITANKEIIAVEFSGWPQLHVGHYGIPEPKSSNDQSAQVDVCIIPAVCYGLNGNRLGRGDGYYDKWLSNYNVKHIIAPAYECQVVESVPANEYDIPVSMIVTEERIIKPR